MEKQDHDLQDALGSSDAKSGGCWPGEQWQRRAPMGEEACPDWRWIPEACLGSARSISQTVFSACKDFMISSGYTPEKLRACGLLGPKSRATQEFGNPATRLQMDTHAKSANPLPPQDSALTCWQFWGGCLLAGPLLYELVVVAATAQLAAALVSRETRFPAWLRQPVVALALAALAALQVALFAGCFVHALGSRKQRWGLDRSSGAEHLLFDKQLAPLAWPFGSRGGRLQMGHRLFGSSRRH
ncbi:hypothetical protein WJX81_008628 [Elliptochloris bilobata]|uniref:Uncharacterized protein n=1 Tax=Elliptochloris bilobata TaxID=381761 RepID=A0AAW1RQS4_9CHLO